MEDNILAAIHSFFLSIGLIMPLGMQNIFILNQGASHKNMINALPSIITTSICEAILISSSTFGVSILVIEIPLLKILVFIVGIIFLTYMGFSTWKSSQEITYETNELSAKEQIVLGISVSFLNPHAIIDCITVLGSNALHYNGTPKIIFTIGCVLTSWIWFVVLSVSGNKIRKIKSGLSIIKILNKLSAIIMMCVALYLTKELFTLLLY